MRNVVFFEYHKSVLSNMNQNLLFRIPAAWMKKNQKFRRCSIIYDQNVTKHVTEIIKQYQQNHLPWKNIIDHPLRKNQKLKALGVKG